jgi:Meiotically up-regulated gene 113
MSSTAITMNNTSYSYKGVPLTPGIAQFLIRKLFADKLVQRQVIVDEVLRAHLAGGGLKASTQDLSATFKRALAAMRENGSAENSSIGYWRILPSSSLEDGASAALEVSPLINEASNPEEFVTVVPAADIELGFGPSAVYVYYLPTYRLRAQDLGEKSWPCKIGRTDRDPLSRVLSQAATALPERPHIALIIRTRHPGAWEAAIHGVLTLRGLQIENSPGVEWFLTSPAEILQLATVFDPAISSASGSTGTEPVAQQKMPSSASVSPSQNAA